MKSQNSAVVAERHCRDSCKRFGLKDGLVGWCTWWENCENIVVMSVLPPWPPICPPLIWLQNWGGTVNGVIMPAVNKL